MRGCDLRNFMQTYMYMHGCKRKGLSQFKWCANHFEDITGKILKEATRGTESYPPPPFPLLLCSSSVAKEKRKEGKENSLPK